MWDNEAPAAKRILPWIRNGRVYLGMLLVGLTGTATATSFTVTLTPETVAVGDTASLQLVFEGNGQINVSQLPQVPGLVVSGPQQSRAYREENGVGTYSFTVTWSLRPVEAKTFEIPPFQARIGSEEYTSPPLQLKAVVAAEPALSGGLAALRVVAPRDQLYVGETLVIELQLLLSQNVTDIADFKMPDFSGDGWLSGEPKRGSRDRSALYRGTAVKVIPINIPLTPLTPGTLSIGPVTTSVTVQVPSQRRQRDVFDVFDMSPFRRTEPRALQVAVPEQTIEVKPLPTNDVPASFSGAVGQFEMAVTAGPTNVIVGDPITLRVELKGSGNLGALSMPQPLVRGDFKTYEPEISLETTDGFGLIGVKRIEQIVIPQNPNITELPPIEFSYFEPEQEVYRTLTQPATPLRVLPAGSRPTPVFADTAGSSANPAQRDDIVHIKQWLGARRVSASVSGLPAGYYAWNGLPLLAWVGVLVWRKRREIRLRDPRRQRETAVRRLVAAQLQDLEEYAASGNSEAFFSTVFRILQEQIGLILDRPASGITESVLDEHLASAGLAETTLHALRDLFQACDAARYAPVNDRQELTASIPKLRELLQELEEVG